MNQLIKKSLSFGLVPAETGQAGKNLFTTRNFHRFEQYFFLLPKNQSAHFIPLATLIGYRRAYTPAITLVAYTDDKAIRFEPVDQLCNIRLYTANSAGNLTQGQRLARLHQVFKNAEFRDRKPHLSQRAFQPALNPLGCSEQHSKNAVRALKGKTAGIVHG
jgi:hypothetical protein